LPRGGFNGQFAADHPERIGSAKDASIAGQSKRTQFRQDDHHIEIDLGGFFEIGVSQVFLW
jgi:hypothetical protein